MTLDNVRMRILLEMAESDCGNYARLVIHVPEHSYRIPIVIGGKFDNIKLSPPTKKETSQIINFNFEDVQLNGFALVQFNWFIISK